MTAGPPVTTVDVTPSAALCDWANMQPHWIRKIVSRVLSSSQALTTDEIENAYAVALIENHLLHGPLQPIPALGPDQRDEAVQEPLLLVALDEVSNVNALAEGQRIDFDPSLTMIFGENASGKTGYARIFKRVAATRTAETEILPNAYQTSATDRTPAATIEYLLGEERHTVDWSNELGLAPLDRISVFDSRAVALHIDQDLGYVFTPAGLELFSSVARSIQDCQERLGTNVDGLHEDNRFAMSFDEGSEVYRIVEGLGPATELQVLSDLANLSDAELARLDELEVAAAALRAGNDRLLLVEARQLLRLAKLLGDSYVPASQFDETKYEEARTSLQGALEASEDARQAIFESDSPFGTPDDEWQAFIAAAERFLDHAGHADYPENLSVCPYCHQSLGEDAADLLSRYRRFLDDALQKAVTESEKAVDAASPQLDGGVLAGAQASLEGLDSTRATDDWIVAGVAFLARAEAAVTALEDRVAITAGLPEMASNALGDLSSIVDRLQSRIEELELIAEQQTESAGLREAELRDLQARRTLRTVLPHIAKYVIRTKLRAALQTLGTMIPNILRSLTRTLNSVSDEIQNRSFGILFDEECAKLDAPQVTVEYHGRLGEAQRHRVVADHQPSEILSDGEQNVLALADFLAECRMRTVSAPIVLDDPVSSLDYHRSKQVAARLVELSETHQVIVFTHNVLFVSDVISLRSHRAERIAFYEIRNDGYRIGIVSPDVEPRLDHPNNIARRIDTLVAEARAAEGSAQDERISLAVDLVRKWLEAFVEQILLGGVVQRFRSNVRLGSVDKIRVERLPEAIAEVSDAFEVTSQYTEAHSQGLEQMNVRFTARNLEELWTKLKDAKDAFEV